MILLGDCRKVLGAIRDNSVYCIVTSPPYFGLRDYGADGQIGLEATVAEYIETMVGVLRECRRVLRPDGTLWLNLGDSYAGSWGNYSPNTDTPAEGWSGERFTRRAYEDRTWRPANSRPQEGLKQKDLIGIPWRCALALQADGWWLRRDIIWNKPNPMPESVTDRPTGSHEYIFLLAKNCNRPLLYRARDTGEWAEAPDVNEMIRMPSSNNGGDRRVRRWVGCDYYYDAAAIREPSVEPERSRADAVGGASWAARNQHSPGGLYTQGKKRRGHARDQEGLTGRWDAMSKEEQCAAGRNKRSVWTVATRPYPDAHFATFPEQLIEPCILAGCPPGGIVLDPFLGAGTVGAVAARLGRRWVGIELNPEYCALARRRTAQGYLLGL